MHKESRHDAWLRTGFVLFIIILLLLIVFNGTAKTSDVSNWIIAFANIAMAAAAVKAWLAARKFLSEFFAQEEYRLAIALINENVIHLGIKNRYTTTVNEALSTLKDLHNKPYSDDSNTRLNNVFSRLQSVQKSHKNWLKNIEELSFRMETYGIFPAENKKAKLEGMVLALDSMIRQGDSLISDMAGNVRKYQSVVRSRTNFSTPFAATSLPEIEATMQEIDKKWNTMVRCRHELLSGGKHARTLFVVREN